MSKLGLTKNYGMVGAKDLLTNCNRVKFTLKYFMGLTNRKHLFQIGLITPYGTSLGLRNGEHLRKIGLTKPSGTSMRLRNWKHMCQIGLTRTSGAARAGEQRRYRDHLEDVGRITKLMLILSGKAEVMEPRGIKYYCKRPCAAHVCTLFSSTANLRESYGSQVYQEMQLSREETWVGPSVTAL